MFPRDPSNREQSFQEFQRVAGFPGVLGVLDCVQVYIILHYNICIYVLYKRHCLLIIVFCLSFCSRLPSKPQTVRTHRM